MASHPTNTAAWLPSKNVHPLEVGPAPYTPPGPGQIVVQNRAVAINPFDGGKQMLSDLVLAYIKYPFILGTDVAGTVVEVGPYDTGNFRVGDRVLGEAVAPIEDSNDPAEGGFQQYTVLRAHLAAEIPESLSFEEACVLPLGLATAAYGLFHKDYLGLELPTVPARKRGLGGDDERAVIITGGASSVGSCAIQLAVAAGYTVYSTCSARNFDFVRGLGATKVFDYRKPGFVDEMVKELKGKMLVGAYAIGDGATEACIRVLRHGAKGSKKFIAFAGVPFSAEEVKSWTGFMSFLGATLVRVVRTGFLGWLYGVSNKFIEMTDGARADSVVAAVFRDFLPQALAKKQLVPAPPPLVVGKGLEKIQEAIDLQQKGTSAQKVVVSL